ncbi:MAG: outer membrane beta-barrel protein, partial [Burkholderiales bacterium]|nr:outer membrane beta-barrel protein [Burkholderiales bacterium]
TASTGYRGGFKEAGREIKPEYLKSYELAYRSVEADGRVIFNANVFYYDWRDQQITVRPGNVLIGLSANAGRSHAYGSELSLAWRPHRRIDLGASAGWLKTQIDDFRESAVGIISDVNYAGKEFPEAPRWSGAIWAVVRFDAGFFASFDLTSRSRSFATSDLANNQSFMVPGYSVAALRVGYETSRYSAVFFVQNLFGRDYISGRDLAGTTYVGDLRTAGVTLTARF